MAGLKRSFRLTRGGAAFAALSFFLCLSAFGASLNMTYLLASLLVAVLCVGLVLPSWNLRGIVCRRIVRGDAYANEPYEVELIVHSARRRRARMVSVEETLGFVPEQGLSMRRLIPEITRTEPVRLTCVLPPRARGVCPLPPLCWSSRYPFGMAESARAAPPEGELVIFPARGRLNRALSMSLRVQVERTGRPQPSGLPGEEYRSLREYRSGDSPRKIHWRASARMGALYVKEMESERAAPVLVLLDSRVPASLAEEDRRATSAALELAISFAAEVCRVALEEGNEVALEGLFPHARVLRERGDAMRTLLEALARLQPSPAEDAEELARAARMAGMTAGQRIIAVTPNRATAETLYPWLARSGARLHVASDPAFSGVFQLVHPEQRVAP